MTAQRRLLSALLVLAACAPVACLQAADPIAAEQLEIDCRGTPCPWAVVSGPARADRDTWTWEDGDVGVDLTGTGPSVVELKVVLLQQTSRTLDLRAAIVRDPAVTLQLQFQWFAAGPGVGSTFWDRQPTALETKSFDLWESGASSVHRTVLVPSEGAALVLRIVKGDAPAEAQVMVGNLTLGHPVGSSL
jgi:hypothetical protein